MSFPLFFWNHKLSDPVSSGVRGGMHFWEILNMIGIDRLFSFEESIKSALNLVV